VQAENWVERTIDKVEAPLKKSNKKPLNGAKINNV